MAINVINSDFWTSDGHFVKPKLIKNKLCCVFISNGEKCDQK